MRRAVYPGSFDPLTNGHFNIIERGLVLFDELIVAVANNISKTPMFSFEERVAMIEEAFPEHPNLRVESFQGLLVDFAAKHHCSCILRGLRAVADFESESQMASMNRHLNADIETVFLMADPTHFYVSSGLVKEVAKLAGDPAGVVPDHVRERLFKHVNSNK